MLRFASFSEELAARVIRDAASAFDMTQREFLAASSRRVCRLRHCATWLAREVSGASLVSLGIVTRRDHTTVLSACQQVQQRVKARDPETIATLERIIRHAQDRTAKARIARRLVEAEGGAW